MKNKKEDALKLFLTEFRDGSSTKWIDDKDYYKTKIYSYYLGDLKKIISGYAKDGLIRRMNPEEILSYDYKTPNLKEECKKRGLKVSGKKADLVTRILDADPNLKKDYENRSDLWICTILGLSVTEDYLDNIAQQEKDSQTLVYTLLSERKYKDAAKVVEELRNKRVFPDWITDDFTSQISLEYETKKIELIWKETPKSLNKVKSAFLDKARYWISWDILRGTNNIRKFENEPTNVDSLSIGQVMQALMIYASGKCQLEDMQKTRTTKGVRIEGLSKDTKLCQECQKLTNKVYDIKKVPVIPNEKCKNSAPCPLCYIADIESPKKKIFGIF